MGTKNNPGEFDCYAKAEQDEPMFVLLGRDPSAYLVVHMWARMREHLGEDPRKVADARACAEAMKLWAAGEGKGVGPSIAAMAHIMSWPRGAP